ncbi:Protein unc-80 like [Quillaja saponaria]|uniref:Protein unc-80 like n=1 Tax=Quillaja saponaria TaxID=32244 RepID=A0AAD7VEB6_QUISA|nr:Protein unc-80 like [Quillaja saponaria]
MTSVCISNCLNDARDPRVPVRATYVNLYKWPESDAEFVKSVSSNGRKESSKSQTYGYQRVVDSISCRQMYLRSYKFSRKESVPEKTQKCFGRVKEKVGNGKKRKPQVRKRKCLVWRKAKENSCSALFRIFYRFLSCAAHVDERIEYLTSIKV